MDNANETNADQPTSRIPGRRRRGAWITLAALGVVGALGVAVWGVNEVKAAMPLAALGMRHGAHGGHGPLLQDPSLAKERAAFALDWVLRSVDATAEQRDSAKAIAQKTIDELIPVAKRHESNAKAMAEALAGATVDREALERIRREEMKLADTASKALVDALAEVSETLTPEQRIEIAILARRAHELHRR
jgi:Spy/CpxP family protein refolding chaperone